MPDLTEAQADMLERNYLAGLITEQEYDAALDEIIRESSDRGRAALKEE